MKAATITDSQNQFLHAYRKDTDVLETLQFDIKEALPRFKALTAKQKKVQRRRTT